MRFESVKQDAAGIGAAIEILKIEDRFDPRDESLMELIYEKSGTRYPGILTEIKPDGGFIYSLTVGGIIYAVYYDASTCGVGEVV
jgi:hypothetical protein